MPPGLASEDALPGLASEDALLAAYIRYRNRRQDTPLLTPGNWRAQACYGRLVVWEQFPTEGKD